MRSKTLSVLLPALLISTVAVAADRTFVIQNQNDKVSIQRVWTAAASTKEAWNEANLSSPIAPGENMTFTLQPGATCFLDVKVQFSDAFEQSFANVNSCRADRVTAR